MREPIYRETGHPKTLMHASDAGGGVIAPAPSSGSIVIYSILASAASTLKETDTNGDVVAYAPAGCSTLAGGLKVTDQKAVFNDTGSNVTVLYTIVDG